MRELTYLNYHSILYLSIFNLFKIMSIKKLNADLILISSYNKNFQLIANLIFHNNKKEEDFIKYFSDKFFSDSPNNSKKISENYFLDNIFWDIEQYLVDHKYIQIINYNDLLKIAENNLNIKDLFIIKSFLGFGIQKGDPLTLSEFREKYSFAYNTDDIILSIGKYFNLVLKLTKDLNI